jgi:NitT/TauT family transport system substrate-binding protein
VARNDAVSQTRRTGGWIALLAALGVLVSACSGASATGQSPVAGSVSITLRLGYFPNVTHAPAIVGLEEGILAKHLGSGVNLETSVFNAGDEAVQAVFSGAIDVTYIGPNPAITAFAQSDGVAARVISGSTSGGASLVVRAGITSAQDLRDTTLASPALGNTQDVALRTWLADNGLETNTEGGGDVSITPLENASIFQAFADGQIDGAWVPEPWATRMVEAGGVVLVDERDLWPKGRFASALVLVRTDFLSQHPDVIERFLEGHVAAVDACNDDPEAAQAAVIDSIETLTGSRLSSKTVATAWKNMEFTVDPIASSLFESATHAEELGLLDPVDLQGLFDLGPLNEVLASLQRKEVHA